MLQERKIQERAILDQFRKLYADFPKGRVMHSEAPDFLLKTSPRYSIGIELSSLPSSNDSIQHKEGYLHFVNDFKQLILKKQDKLVNYRKKMANEYWLIIYSETFNPGSFNFINHFEKINPGRTFDRIFFLDVFSGKIYEV